MSEIIRDYSKKKYNAVSKSVVKLNGITEIMQLDNIIEQSVERDGNSGYEIFIDMIETRVAVNKELKPMQKIALNLYFLTEEIKITADNEMKALKVSNKEAIEDKWKVARETYFPDETLRKSEIMALIKNDMDYRIKDDRQLLSFVTQPLLYDIFFGGYYGKKEAERKKVQENFILDMNLPVKMHYTSVEKNDRENIIEVKVSLDKNSIVHIKLMDIFKKLQEEYKPSSVFLEGAGRIILDSETGRIKKAELRISGGISGVFTNTQEVMLLEMHQDKSS